MNWSLIILLTILTPLASCIIQTSYTIHKHLGKTQCTGRTAPLSFENSIYRPNMQCTGDYFLCIGRVTVASCSWTTGNTVRKSVWGLCIASKACVWKSQRKGGLCGLCIAFRIGRTAPLSFENSIYALEGLQGSQLELDNWKHCQEVSLGGLCITCKACVWKSQRKGGLRGLCILDFAQTAQVTVLCKNW